MKTRRSFIFLSLLCGFTVFTNPLLKAQPAINTSSYNTAIGLRGGFTSGITIKHFIGTNTALEGIIGIWPNGASFTGLYEKYASTGVAGLNWYYGGGAHVSFESNTYYNRDYPLYRRYYRNGGMAIGIDGIVGIEYKIKPIPIAVCFDLKPFYEINTGGGSYLSLDPGVGIKFTF